MELLNVDLSHPNFEMEHKLLRFRDITDPATVELVDPDNLSASFGKGYTLKRVTYQVTNDPVTKGMDERLPWLDELEQGTLIKGNYQIPVADNVLAARISSSAFKLDLDK